MGICQPMPCAEPLSADCDCCRMMPVVALRPAEDGPHQQVPNGMPHDMRFKDAEARCCWYVVGNLMFEEATTLCSCVRYFLFEWWLQIFPCMPAAAPRWPAEHNR